MYHYTGLRYWLSTNKHLFRKSNKQRLFCWKTQLCWVEFILLSWVFWSELQRGVRMWCCLGNFIAFSSLPPPGGWNWVTRAIWFIQFTNRVKGQSLLLCVFMTHTKRLQLIYSDHLSDLAQTNNYEKHIELLFQDWITQLIIIVLKVWLSGQRGKLLLHGSLSGATIVCKTRKSLSVSWGLEENLKNYVDFCTLG